MVDSLCSSGSLTKRGGSFCVAHETNVIVVANNRAEAMFFRSLGISASINYSISRLHLDAARQTAGDDIADSCRGFNRRNANFSNQSALPQNKHFRVRFDALASTKI